MSAVCLAISVSACQKSLESAAPEELKVSCDQRLKFAVLLSIAVENPDGMTIDFQDAQGASVQGVNLVPDKRHELPGTAPVESYWDDIPYLRFLRLEEGGQLLLSAVAERTGVLRVVVKTSAGLTREARVEVVADACGHPITQNIHFDIP